MSEAKAAAGRAAAGLVEDGMVLGLGTGSTVAWFLDALAARELDVAGVPTSLATAQRCEELGLRTVGLGEVERLDLVVDGADELTPALVLTKGGGGALLREKVVAALRTRMVVVATADKVVSRLGATFPLPVEVVEFALPTVERALRRSGATAVRARDDGAYRTDNGHPILDATFGDGIPEPARLAADLDAVPGLLAHGLFVDLATEALLGSDDGSVQALAPTGAA